MAKPKNLKQRKGEDTVKDLNKITLDPFKVVEERGWGRVRSLSSNGSMVLDWRIQWEDDDRRKRQLVRIKLDNVPKNGELVVSRQELERYLRHV